jgi:hypothetical protein
MLSYLGFLTLAGLTACGGAGAVHAESDADPASAARAPLATPHGKALDRARDGAATPSPSGTATHGAPKFTAKISKVTRDQVRYSWRPSCPVPYQDLRMITMTYWGFDHKAHTGRLVVNKSVADDLVPVFHKLYRQRFPIMKMEPVDKYKGDDYDSIEAGNTSAFNCRQATGSGHWSEHAYGLAVDLNTLQNPYVNADGTNAHRNADKYVKRPLHKPGVINPGDNVVKAFAAIGWGWGGNWSGAKDYQHFSQSGH